MDNKNIKKENTLIRVENEIKMENGLTIHIFSNVSEQEVRSAKYQISRINEFLSESNQNRLIDFRIEIGEYHFFYTVEWVYPLFPQKGDIIHLDEFIKNEEERERLHDITYFDKECKEPYSIIELLSGLKITGIDWSNGKKGIVLTVTCKNEYVAKDIIFFPGKFSEELNLENIESRPWNMENYEKTLLALKKIDYPLKKCVQDWMDIKYYSTEFKESFFKKIEDPVFDLVSILQCNSKQLEEVCKFTQEEIRMLERMYEYHFGAKLIDYIVPKR